MRMVRVDDELFNLDQLVRVRWREVERELLRAREMDPPRVETYRVLVLRFAEGVEAVLSAEEAQKFLAHIGCEPAGAVPAFRGPSDA